MTKLTTFPPKLVLVDTGKRRSPGSGEIFFYQTEDGTIVGPCQARPPSTAYVGPRCTFAIYALQTED